MKIPLCNYREQLMADALCMGQKIALSNPCPCPVFTRACLQFNFLRPAACPRDPVGSGFMQQDFALFKISGSRGQALRDLR
ncbi:MAG: hypothetical protein WC627_13310, partial [Legionella sp.]